MKKSDIIVMINAHVGKQRRKLEGEFLTCKNGPYVTYFNSNSSRAAGIGIAIRLCADINVIDTEQDDDDRILILMNNS